MGNPTVSHHLVSSEHHESKRPNTSLVGNSVGNGTKFVPRDNVCISAAKHFITLLQLTVYRAISCNCNLVLPQFSSFDQSIYPLLEQPLEQIQSVSQPDDRTLKLGVI